MKLWSSYRFKWSRKIECQKLRARQQAREQNSLFCTFLSSFLCFGARECLSKCEQRKLQQSNGILYYHTHSSKHSFSIDQTSKKKPLCNNWTKKIQNFIFALHSRHFRSRRRYVVAILSWQIVAISADSCFPTHEWPYNGEEGGINHSQLTV